MLQSREGRIAQNWSNSRWSGRPEGRAEKEVWREGVVRGTSGIWKEKRRCFICTVMMLRRREGEEHQMGVFAVAAGPDHTSPLISAFAILRQTHPVHRSDARTAWFELSLCSCPLQHPSRVPSILARWQLISSQSRPDPLTLPAQFQSCTLFSISSDAGHRSHST